MQFFSVYDLLIYKANKKNIALEDMYLFFKTKKIKKAQIDNLKQTAYIPNEVKKDVLDFLDMTELEVNLAMGIIPRRYQKSFFDNISIISKLLSEQDEQLPEAPNLYFENAFGRLYNDDCINVLKHMPNDCVEMVFADPPFNLGKTYDPCIDDNLTMSQYLNWTFEWVDECIRVLKPGGHIFIYNIPKWCVYIAGHLIHQLSFWDWIAVDMKSNLPIQSRLYPAHYALISFVKGTKAATFNNQRIPMEVCRHCGGEIKDYGGYKVKMNPSGVNVSDIWSDIYPVRHKSIKNRRFNELSVKFLDRIISMSTNPGDTIFDPFGGSGTTYAVAQLLHRSWIGSELGDCEVIKQRLTHPQKDKTQLEKVYAEKGHLFTKETLQRRSKNGFWTCETVETINAEKVSDRQLSLEDLSDINYLSE